MLVSDKCWYFIIRHVKGRPAVHSKAGVIDAVAASSVDNALAMARQRNPVRSCEFLEAYPTTRDWEAKRVRADRIRQNQEFLELMQAQGWAEREFGE